MKKSLKVLFFGNERIATGINTEAILFNAISKGPHELVGLVIHSSGSTSRKSSQEPVVESAETLGVPVLNPAKLADSIDDIKNLGADIGVLVAYGKIIPQPVIDLFPNGIINLHPSLLPKLRGSTPIEATILSGAKESAVTIMKLVAKMDAGPIIAQKKLSISGQETKQELADLLHDEGCELMLRVLDETADSESKETQQIESDATFCTTINKADGQINWSNSAIQTERQVRAYSGWPTSFFEVNSQRYVIAEAEILDQKVSDKIGDMVADNNSLKVQTSDGVVSITSIQPAGKKRMPISAFLSGYRSKLNI